MNSLYRYRDHYFETRGVESAKDKASDVDNMLKETLKTLDKLQCGLHFLTEYSPNKLQ